MAGHGKREARVIACEQSRFGHTIYIAPRAKLMMVSSMHFIATDMALP